MLFLILKAAQSAWARSRMGASCGVLIARRVGENAAPLFSHWLPKDNEASLIYGVVADRVDRIRAGGHTTSDKQTTARVVFVHP